MNHLISKLYFNFITNCFRSLSTNVHNLREINLNRKLDEFNLDFCSNNRSSYRERKGDDDVVQIIKDKSPLSLLGWTRELLLLLLL